MFGKFFKSKKDSGAPPAVEDAPAPDLKARFDEDEWNLLLLLPGHGLASITECSGGFDGTGEDFVRAFAQPLKSDFSSLHNALRSELTVGNVEDALACTSDEAIECMEMTKSILDKKLDQKEHVQFLCGFVLSMAKAVSKEGGMLDMDTVDGIYLMGSRLGISEDLTRYFVTGELPPGVTL